MIRCFAHCETPLRYTRKLILPHFIVVIHVDREDGTVSYKSQMHDDPHAGTEGFVEEDLDYTEEVVTATLRDIIDFQRGSPVGGLQLHLNPELLGVVRRECTIFLNNVEHDE